MIKEQDFLKEYPICPNIELIVDIACKWHKLIPALKNNERLIWGETLDNQEEYCLKIDPGRKTTDILFRKGETIHKIEVPDFINEYFHYLFDCFAFFQDFEEPIELEGTNYLYDKLLGIRIFISNAHHVSLFEGESGKLKWCNLRELTKWEFSNLIPRIICIANHCNQYAFTPNTSLKGILNFYLANEDSAISCDSCWNVEIDYCFVTAVKINTTSLENENCKDIGIFPYAIPKFAEKTIETILEVRKPWFAELPEDAFEDFWDG